MPRTSKNISSLPAIAVVLSRNSQNEVDASAAELERLMASLGIRSIARVVHPPRRGALLVGTGKLAELKGRIEELRAEYGPGSLLLAVDEALRAGEMRRLEKALDVPVIDRTGVVLRVFEQRARTPVARLEVEIARLEYEAPRVRDDESLGDREGGGGRGGRGHSNVELEKQRIRERLARLRRQLEGLSARQERQLSARREELHVSLIGYTNAGKSSLMRALTGCEAQVEDALFVTLGTTVRALKPPLSPPVFVSDTVGFIRNLPHGLVASFRSTLAEARDASLLLHVIDASDPEWREQVRTTEEAIEAIGGGGVPALLVFNKIDLVPSGQRRELARELPGSIQLSAHDPADVVRLRDAVAVAFAGELEISRLEVPFAEGRLLSEIRNRGRVLRETYTERGVVLAVRALPEDLSVWKRALPEERGPSTAAEAIELAAERGLRLRPESVQLDESGLDFRVAHARDEEGTSWVVRLPRRQEVHASTLVEAKALDLIRPLLPVAVPAWEIHEPGVIAYRRLAGEPAWRFDPASGLQWKGVDPTAPSDGFVSSLARTLAALQGISMKDARAEGVPVRRIQEVRSSIAQAIDETRSELSPPDRLLSRWRRWLDDDGCWPVHLALVHGDLHPGHMLLDAEGALTGVLDWTEAQVTDPSVDFALFYGCFGLDALGRLTARFKEFGGTTWPRMIEHTVERWAVFPALAASWAIGAGNEAALRHARSQIAASVA